MCRLQMKKQKKMIQENDIKINMPCIERGTDRHCVPAEANHRQGSKVLGCSLASGGGEISAKGWGQAEVKARRVKCSQGRRLWHRGTSRDLRCRLTFPRNLSPLIVKAPTRHQDTKKGRLRLETTGPPSSILSETFRVCRYQKYTEGVVCAHSGSEGTWLWMCLPGRAPALGPTAPHHSCLLLSSSACSLRPVSSSKVPGSPHFPLLLLFGFLSPKSLEFFNKGHFSHGTGNWKLWLR